MTNIRDLERSYRRYALYELEHTPKTLKQTVSILENLIQFEGTGLLENISTKSVRDFLHEERERKSWSAKTFRIYRQCLKTYFQWVVEEGWMNENPVNGIKQPPLPQRLPRCLSKEEMLKIFFHVHQYPWLWELQRARNEAIFSMITYTGVRLSELINLKVMDIDFTSDWVRVIQGKKRKDRNIPMNSELKPILLRYKNAHAKLGTPSIWFFPSVKSGSQLTDKNVQDVFRKVSKSSKIKVTPHMLRHTFGRLLVESGVHMRTAQDYMGHADIRTTQIYTYVSSQQSQKEMGKLCLFSSC